MEAAFPTHLCASGVLASLLHAYSGGAAPVLFRIPIKHRVLGVIRYEAEVRQAFQLRTYEDQISCKARSFSLGRVVVEVWSEPALDFDYTHSLALVVVGHLIAIDFSETEVA
jgi:hypothetical protein